MYANRTTISGGGVGGHRSGMNPYFVSKGFDMSGGGGAMGGATTSTSGSKKGGGSSSSGSGGAACSVPCYRVAEKPINPRLLDAVKIYFAKKFDETKFELMAVFQLEKGTIVAFHLNKKHDESFELTERRRQLLTRYYSRGNQLVLLYHNLLRAEHYLPIGTSQIAKFIQSDSVIPEKSSTRRFLCKSASMTHMTSSTAANNPNNHENSKQNKHRSSSRTIKSTAPSSSCPYDNSLPESISNSTSCPNHTESTHSKQSKKSSILLRQNTTSSSIFNQVTMRMRQLYTTSTPTTIPSSPDQTHQQYDDSDTMLPPDVSTGNNSPPPLDTGPHDGPLAPEQSSSSSVLTTTTNTTSNSNNKTNNNTNSSSSCSSVFSSSMPHTFVHNCSNCYDADSSGQNYQPKKCSITRSSSHA